MTNADLAAPTDPYSPPRPHLVACACFAAVLAILAAPMLGGQWLANELSDQYSAGWAFRSWAAAELRRTGSVPQWNPTLFGGLPFVGASHGDIVYPTSWLRLLLSTPTVVNINFVVHYLLAAIATYAFARLHRIAWIGAVTAGLAYMLTGLVASYPNPGHDGKLIVSSLLPVLLIGLTLGLRDDRWVGHAIVAVATALGLASPHYQMTYYMLMAGAVYALVLLLRPGASAPLPARLARGGLAIAAVLAGFGAVMIQILPFYHYLPFSPRATGYRGFEGSTSFAIPWEHVPEFLFSDFTGHTDADTYWGSNGLKLHSEYLGLPVVALALLGVLREWGGVRRTLVRALLAVGLLFLLIALGAGTPFYRLFYELVPYVKQTRAPGMAFFVVGFVTAVFAGLGAERLARREAAGWGLGWAVAGGLLLLLALGGAVSGLAQGLANGVQGATGIPALERALQGENAIRLGAAASALALLALGLVALGWQRGVVPAAALAFGAPLVVAGDLIRNAQPFWHYAPIDFPLFKGDAITQRLASVPVPFRVLELDAYPHSTLMGYGINTVLGYHGNELHNYDELWGGKNVYKNLGNPTLWELYAVNHVVVGGDQRLDSLPGFDKVLAGVPDAGGKPASLFSRRVPVPYARLVPAAIAAPRDQAIQAITAGRAFQDQVVLLDSTASRAPAPPATLPPPLASTVRVTSWSPGAMSLMIEPAPPQDAYVVVAENWYPDWHATVDGQAAPTWRGNVAMLTVPVKAGAKEVSLTFRSADYATGKVISIAFLLLIAVGAAAGVLHDRQMPRAGVREEP